MELWTCVLLLSVAAVGVTSEDQPPANKEWLELMTPQGPVRGRRDPQAEHLFVFYNIPYATAPTKENKFKPPQPAPTWTTPFDAIYQNVVCPQTVFPVPGFPSPGNEQEDCLIANVYVPDTQDKNLTVLVYVHGGAFVLGYGTSIKLNRLLEKKDIILVTFNYRLGIHGFLCLGTEDVPGNAGMKDQVELLRWVQRNIESYGGNPRDVILGGSSAGSSSVDLLMLSKSTEGLFQRVIAESGGNLAAFAIQRDPVAIAKYQAAKLNFTNVDDISALEQFYKTLPMEVLTADSFWDRTDSTFLFSPCIERESATEPFLTESPLSILKKGNYTKLPLLYGFANMEGLFRVNFFDAWTNQMNEKFSDFLPADLTFESASEKEEVANKIKKFYFEDKPITVANVLDYVDFFTDAIFAFPVLLAVKLQAEAGNKEIYLYEYSFVDENTPYVPYTNVTGANHCAQSDALMDGRNEDLETIASQNMRKIIRESWYNFIKSGKPMPEWQAAGADRSPYMSLGVEVGLINEPLLGNRTQLWDEIYENYYLEPVTPSSHALSFKINYLLLPIIITVHVVFKSLKYDQY